MEKEKAEEKKPQPRLAKKPVREKSPEPPADVSSAEPPGVDPASIVVNDGVTADVPTVDPKELGLPDKAEHMKRLEETREPFGALSRKMDVPAIPGWHQHWFNDSGGNIMEADKRGYVHVLDRNGKKKSLVVGSHPNQPGALTAYLMAIPIEWYEESCRAEQALADKIDQDLKRGSVSGEPGQDGRYIPKDETTGRSRIQIKE